MALDIVYSPSLSLQMANVFAENRGRPPWDANAPFPKEVYPVR
jgi:hypothetical protein